MFYSLYILCISQTHFFPLTVTKPMLSAGLSYAVEEIKHLLIPNKAKILTSLNKVKVS